MRNLKFHRCTSDDVAGIVEAHPNTGGNLSPNAVGHSHQIPADAFCVAARVQDRRIFVPIIDLQRWVWWWIKHHRIWSGSLTEFLYSHLLQVGGTAENHRQERCGWFCAEHRPLKAKTRQHAQATTMVNVCVCANHGIQTPEVQSGWNLVALFLRHRTLEQTKVNENASLLRLHQGATSGYFACSPKERQ
jgi:hypothetical protein